MFDPRLGYDPNEDPMAKTPFDPCAPPAAFEDVYGNRWQSVGRVRDDRGRIATRYVTPRVADGRGHVLAQAMERDVVACAPPLPMLAPVPSQSLARVACDFAGDPVDAWNPPQAWYDDEGNQWLLGSVTSLPDGRKVSTYTNGNPDAAETNPTKTLIGFPPGYGAAGVNGESAVPNAAPMVGGILGGTAGALGGWHLGGLVAAMVGLPVGLWLGLLVAAPQKSS